MLLGTLLRYMRAKLLRTGTITTIACDGSGTTGESGWVSDLKSTMITFGLALTVCGMNGFIVLAVLLLLRLMNFVNSPAEKCNSSTREVLLLHLVGSLLTLPSGVVWLRNLLRHGEMTLTNDPSFLAAILFVMTYRAPAPYWFKTVRPLVLPPLVGVLLLRFGGDNLPAVATLLCAVAGLYSNPRLLTPTPVKRTHCTNLMVPMTTKKTEETNRLKYE